MPRAHHGLIAGGLSLLICLCFSPAARAGEPTVGWEATLALSATAVLPGEPVFATCTLNYRGDVTFTGYAGFGRAVVVYTGPSGEELTGPFAAPAFRGASDEAPPPRPVPYRRGFSLATTSPLLYGSEGCFFEAEGTGQVKVRAEIWQGRDPSDYRLVTVSSAPVTITVLPLPAEESAAYDLWHDEQVARMFLAGEAETATQAKVKRLATDFPQSAYAKYALLALASQRRSFRERLGRGFLPPPQREEAGRLAAREVELLEQARARDTASRVTPVVLYQLLTAARWLADAERQERVPQYATALLALPDVPAPYREDALRTIQVVGAGAQAHTLVGSASLAPAARAAPARPTTAARPRSTPRPRTASAPVRRTPT